MIYTIYTIAAILKILKNEIDVKIGEYTYIKERCNGLLDRYENLINSCNLPYYIIDLDKIINTVPITIYGKNVTYEIEDENIKNMFLVAIFEYETGWYISSTNTPKLEESIIKDIIESDKITKLDTITLKSVN